MSEEFLANLSLDKLIRIIYRQRNRAAAFAASMIILIAIALLLIPKKYQSEGKLFVQLGRGGVTLDPTTTTSQTIMIQESREAEVNSVIDILQSRGLLCKVIEHPEIGVDRLLAAHASPINIPLPQLPRFTSPSEAETKYDNQKQLDIAIKTMSSNLGVTVPRKAANITLWYTSQSPEFSQKVIDVLMHTYVDQHVKARKTEGSFAFFEKQMQMQRKKVEFAAKELSDLKNRIGVMSIGERRSTLRQRISSIESSLIDSGAQLAANQSRMEEAKQLIEDTPQNLLVEETQGVAHHASDLMRNRLYDLELQEKQLLSKYSADHPQVVAVRAEVEDAEGILGKQFQERKLTKTGINENVQSLKMNMMNAFVETSAIRSEQQVLQEKLKSANMEMERLNQDEIFLAQLARNLEINEANFRRYADKLEEARINTELDFEKISNVKIVQNGSYQVQHVSPRRGIIFAGSIIFVGLAGLCFALLCDHWINTLNSEDEIRETLNLDVLGFIPTFSKTEQQFSLPQRITHDPSTP